MARTHSSITTFILASIAALIVAAGAACENTARGAKQDAEAAIVAGYDCHLPKPVAPADLIRAIKSVIAVAQTK